MAADGTLQFVLVDDDPPGARNVAMHLHVGGGFHGATILLADGALARSAVGRVKLGGQAVAANGSWSEPAAAARGERGTA